MPFDSRDDVGNGRATAITFAREGATLVLVNRSYSSLEATQKLIADQGVGAECIALQADIRDEDEIRRIIDTALAEFGRVDVLHNNVGIGTLNVARDTPEIDLNDWNEILAVNLTASMLLAKHTLPSMRERHSGSIIFVGSTSAHATSPLIAYKVSKAALHEFAVAVAVENAPYNIRCNALMPGLIDTPMATAAYRWMSEGQKNRSQIVDEFGRRVPMGRAGSPWEVAQVAAFLASEDAAYVTAQVFRVDGGLLANIGSAR